MLTCKISSEISRDNSVNIQLLAVVIKMNFRPEICVSAINPPSYYKHQQKDDKKRQNLKQAIRRAQVNDWGFLPLHCVSAAFKLLTIGMILKMNLLLIFSASPLSLAR